MTLLFFRRGSAEIFQILRSSKLKKVLEKVNHFNLKTKSFAGAIISQLLEAYELLLRLVWFH